MTNKTLACRSGKKGHGQDERRQNTSSQRSPTPDASSDSLLTRGLNYVGSMFGKRKTDQSDVESATLENTSMSNTAGN